MKEQHKEYVLGGGCFWCLEAIFQDLMGVLGVTSGYAGGVDPHPNYETIHDPASGHAEVVKVAFDAAIIPDETLLDIFFVSHDPTTLNRQGNDVGPAYRSIMLFSDAEQERLFKAAKQRAEAVWDDPIVTEIVPLETFYEAEAEQQNFFRNHPEQAYCQVIIAPKLHKVRQKYAKWFALNQG